MASHSDKAGILIAANFVKYAVGFIMPMVLVRMLDKEDYGTFQQLQLIGATLAGILFLGLPTSIYYFYQREGAHTRRALIVQTVGMLVASGLVAVAILVLGAPSLSRLMNNPALSSFLPIFALSVGLGIAGEHFVHFMIAQDRYAVAVVFEVVETAVRVIVSLIPLMAGYGLLGLVWALVALALARAMVRNVLLLNGIGWDLRVPRKERFVREQLDYSIPMCLTLLVGYLGGSLDRMIISANFTLKEYAVYTVGALEIPLDTIFQVAVANVLRAALPSLVQEGRFDEIVRLVRESTRRLSIIMLPSFVFLLGFAHEFITLLFTTAYTDSVAVFRIYLFLVPLHMLILSPIPQAFGRTRINFYIVTVTMALNVIASFTLLKWVGFLGPAISLVASNWVIAATFLTIGARLLHTSPMALLPLASLARVCAAAGIALFASKTLAGNAPLTLVGFATSGLVFGALFVALAAVLRVFTERDRDVARRWIARLSPLRAR